MYDIEKVKTEDVENIRQKDIEKVKPEKIEKRSFEIIESELGVELDPILAPIIKRVIHTTADFDYLNSLYFSENVVNIALDLLRNNARIITDTNMAKAGINKSAAEKLGIRIDCFMADEEVAKKAKELGVTRAQVSMEKASLLKGPIIFVIGNAPTALIKICEMYDLNILKPDLIIGVPVGFVNVVTAKEMIIERNFNCIVARGRKGGSNVAAAIVNALMYMITR